MAEWKNRLYYGDNLDVLRELIESESVDLVYLDPPFNSNATYNVLFAEQDGSQSPSQIKAFEDTWNWAQAARQYEETVEAGGQVSRALQSFQTLLGDSNMLAYLTMMAPRLVELRRVLKPTGSIYLHCDPTASHYLKLLMDAVFGPENFRNEIVWMRTLSKGLMTRQLPTNHDVLLGYRRSEDAIWNVAEACVPYNEDALDEKTASKYASKDDAGRRYQLTSLINPNSDRPNLTYEFLGVTRVWRWTRERMEKAYQDGMVVQTKPGAVPRYKRYLDEQRGKSLGDVWTDIPPLNSQAQERMGFQTQKPEALLARIIRISSQEGDLVLDPFCGCGTTIAAAEQLNRRWIGIDITHLAIAAIRHRFQTEFPDRAPSYDVIGEPVSIPDAEELAATDPYQFQWWALGRVGARPVEEKKGADRGIDGRLYFHDEERAKTKQIIFSVKAGAVNVAHVRDLRGVIEREKAEIGVLISMREPTTPMLNEAASAGFYTAHDMNNKNTKHPRLQILTIREILEGKEIDKPRNAVNVTLKRAPKAKDRSARHLRLDGIK